MSEITYYVGHQKVLNAIYCEILILSYTWLVKKILCGGKLNGCQNSFVDKIVNIYQDLYLEKNRCYGKFLIILPFMFNSYLKYLSSDKKNCN